MGIPKSDSIDSDSDTSNSQTSPDAATTVTQEPIESDPADAQGVTHSTNPVKPGPIPKQETQAMATTQSDRNLKQLSVDAAVAELMTKEYPMREARAMAANHLLADVSGTYAKLAELGHK